MPHLLALARMADEWEQRKAAVVWQASWGASDVLKETPEAIRAALVRTGTANPPAQVYVSRTRPHRQDGITDFGLSLVAELREEGWTE